MVEEWLLCCYAAKLCCAMLPSYGRHSERAEMVYAGSDSGEPSCMAPYTAAVVAVTAHFCQTCTNSSTSKTLLRLSCFCPPPKLAAAYRSTLCQ